MQSSQIIAMHLREQSEWRAWKGEEYPEDDRNAISSRALEALAEHVETLPDEDSRIEALSVAIVGDRFMPGEEASRMISRYGFFTPGPRQASPDPDEFLTELAELVPREHRETTEGS
jgi:hypothetical protein